MAWLSVVRLEPGKPVQEAVAAARRDLAIAGEFVLISGVDQSVV